MIHFGLPAYVGPGAGFAFLGSLLSLISAVAAAIVSVLIYPFRMAWLAIARPHRGQFRRAIFLGFDGLDPAVTESLMAEGKLPNLARLRDTGSYRRLRTTFPPTSVVAWSTFATGVNPAKHNVFGDSRRPDRKSEPFWRILGQHAVKSTILQVPGSSQPQAFNGRELCAGEAGTGSVFTGPEGQLQGPEGARIPFSVGDGRVLIQGHSVSLSVGEFTPWTRLRVGSNRMIVRFLLIQAEPEIVLYATGVQPQQISYPRMYATYLAKRQGPYSTNPCSVGLSACDPAASEKAFLCEARVLNREREAMLSTALETTPNGVVACIFETYPQPDMIEIDGIVGAVLSRAGRQTAVFVLSGHGFCAARRSVNLNAWLRREGYQVVAGAEIDWARTRAYAEGTSGVYLNVRGREKQGIVKLEEAAALRAELAQKLAELVDSDIGEVAILSAHSASDLYHGPYLNAGPDVVIGYAAGYCSASQAADGRKIFDNVTGSARGNYAVDPSLVPGVLFSNLKITANSPGIEDMAPTALTLFGVHAPAWMDGRAVVATA